MRTLSVVCGIGYSLRGYAYRSSQLGPGGECPSKWMDFCPPMKMHVYLSATAEDQKDLSLGVVEKALESLFSIPVRRTPEDPKEETVQSLLNLIAQCSHYIGIFTPLRGSCPTCLSGQSFLEAEHRRAVAARQPRGYFCPRPNSEFHLSRLERSKSSMSEPEQRKHEAFLRQIPANRTLFNDAIELGMLIAQHIECWRNPRMKHIGTPNSTAGSEASAPADPTIDLGHHLQANLFRRERAKLFADKRPGCFLVHGPNGYGVDKLATRLRHECESRQNVRVEGPIDLKNAAYHQSGQEILTLLHNRLAAKKLQRPGIPALASAIRSILETQALVLCLESIDKWTDSLPGFVHKFWRPLAQRFVEKPAPHSFLVIVTRELPADAGPPEPQSPLPHDSVPIVELPYLTVFEKADIGEVLSAKGCADPYDLAEKIVDETKGIPIMVYEQVRKAISHLTLQE